MNDHWKARFGVLLVFLLGGLVGGLSASIYFHHRMALFLERGPAAYVDVLERRLTRHLHLDASQKQQIHDDMMENLAQRKLLQAQIRPQVKMLNQQTIQQIRTILTPDQLIVFHENLAELHKRAALQADAAPIGTPNTNTTPVVSPTEQ
jgi:hypothetical protein